MFKRMVGFIEDEKFFGEVVAIDFENNKVAIKDKHGRQKNVNIKDVIVMEEVFTIHDTLIFDKDVLMENEFGTKYLVNLHDDGQVSLDKLNNNLEIIQEGTKHEISHIVMALEDLSFSLLGNLYELRLKLQEPNFNINIVKGFNGKYYTYYIAINDKKNKEIDLIDVDTLIKGEEYERKTVSYEYYMSAISDGEFREVLKNEFNNYVTGATYERGKYQSNAFSVELPIMYGVNCKILCKKDENFTDTNKQDVNKEAERCEFCGTSLSNCYCRLLWD